MNDLYDDELIAAVARDIVVEIAPAELPMFRVISEKYFRNPRKTLVTQRGKDEMLGFGDGTMEILLTPVVLSVVTEVVKFVVSTLATSVKDGGSELAKEAAKDWFTKYRNSGKMPSFNDAQRGQVRRLAFDKALGLGLPIEQANLLADSMVGGLSSTKGNDSQKKAGD